MIKRAIKKVFRMMGYALVPANAPPPKGPSNPFTMGGALIRSKQRGVKVNTVIDIGASNGMWSEACMKTYPDAQYLLIDAQEAHKNDLEKFVASRPNAKYVIAAAGNREGKIYFDNSDLLGGLASETPLAGSCIEVPVTTIDIEIRKHNLKPPFLIKLDTHGYEIPILEGAANAMENASLLVIEQYNYQLTDDSLRYYEMADYLFKKGFFSVDIVDLFQRAKDKTLWQMDVFYQPKSSIDFDSRSYK